jgi:alpha-glucosidase
MLLLTLRGTPTLYYGDELGMHNVPIPPERVQDPFEKNVPGIGVGRDPSRTPMQWSPAANAGFTTGEPWLPIAEDFGSVNVEVESFAPRALLTLYRELIQLRRREASLSIGTFTAVPTQGDLLAYRRQFGDARRFLIVLNLGPDPAALHSAIGHCGTIALSTHLDRQLEPIAGEIELRGNEGVIVQLDDR